MEQNNRFAVLASRAPSPAPSLHEAPPLGAFTSTLDLAAMEIAANETYYPTPELPPPTTPQPSSWNIPAAESSQPIELITEGAQRLDRLMRTMESSSHHPSLAGNPLDHTDPSDWENVAVWLDAVPDDDLSQALERINPPAQAARCLEHAYATRQAHRTGSPNLLSASQGNALQVIRTFITFRDTSPSPSDMQALAPAPPDDYVTPPSSRRAILTIDTDLARPMAYSIPPSPASPVDSVMGIELPMAVAERMRFARSPRTPSGSQPTTPQSRRYSPSELMDMDSATRMEPQGDAMPTDSRMASPISSPSTPTPTPQQLQLQNLIATSEEQRSPIDTEMRGNSTNDSIMNFPLEGQATTPPPHSSQLRDSRTTRHGTRASGPRAETPESEDEEPVLYGEDTQTRETWAILDEARVLVSGVPRPTPTPEEADIMDAHTGVHVGECAISLSRNSAEQLNLIRLGYGHLVQREPVYPVLDGENVGDDEAVNAAYKLVCASLSTGFSSPNNTTDRNLHAENWFRASALVLASVLRGILSSDDVKHLGAFLPSVHDDFTHHESVPYPESRLHLVETLAEQVRGELSDQGGRITDGDMVPVSLWSTTRRKIFSKAKAQARERAERRLEQWCKGWTEELVDRKVSEIYLLIITKMEEEGERHEERLRSVKDLKDLTDQMEQTYAREYREALQRRTLDAIKREEREKREAAMKRVRDEVENEVQEWKRKHLDTRVHNAIREQVASTHQTDLDKIQKEESEKLIAERKIFARRFADHQFENWVIEEQHRRWPEVEQRAQQGTEAEALAEERNRIYPGLISQAYKEITAEIAELKSKRIEKRQKELDAILEREDVELIRAAAGAMGFNLVLRGEGKGPSKRPKRDGKSVTVLTDVKSTDDPVAGAKRDASGRTRSESVAHDRTPPQGDPDTPMVVEPSSGETTPTTKRAKVTLPFNEGAEIATELVTRALESARSPKPTDSVRMHVALVDYDSLPPSPGEPPKPPPTRPEMVRQLVTNPEVERERGVVSSAHNPKNDMEAEPSLPPPPAPVPQETPEAPTPPSLEDRQRSAATSLLAEELRKMIGELVTPLAQAVQHLSTRMEAFESRPTTTIPAPAATRAPQPVQGKAASSMKPTPPATLPPALAAPRAPQPVKGKAPSVPHTPATIASPTPTGEGSSTTTSAPTMLGAHTISPALPAPLADKAPVSGAARPRVGEREFTQVNRHRIKASFAVVTQTNMAQNGAARSFNAQVASAQGRTTAGKPRASSVAANTKPSVTDVVVLRDGGFQDEEKEATLRARLPGSIVREVQADMQRHLRLPLKILKGRWSQTSGVTGNFVYTLVGNLPFAYISSFKKYLCAPFLGAELITTEGWKWAHLRNVHLHNDKLTVWSPEALEEQVRLNPMFERATFSCSPHWLSDPHRLIGATATVLFAYEDLDGSITRAALEQGVAMFGAPVQFILSGDRPTLVQCGRCHQVGHRDGSTFCPVPITELRCVRCGKNHDSRDHDYECPNQHRVAGKCDCQLPCLLCGKKGHNARSRKCAKRGDFGPPPYARIRSDKAPVETAGETPPEPSTRPLRKRGPRRPKARVDDEDANLFAEFAPPSEPVAGPLVDKGKAKADPPTIPTRPPRTNPTVPEAARDGATHQLRVLTEENAAGQARVCYKGIEHLVLLDQMSRAYIQHRENLCRRLDQIAKGVREAYDERATSDQLAHLEISIATSPAFRTIAPSQHEDPAVQEDLQAELDHLSRESLPHGPIDLSRPLIADTPNQLIAINNIVDKTHLWAEVRDGHPHTPTPVILMGPGVQPPPTLPYA
ncbi:hypothetical protein EDB85DRAFT_2156738 [Lactarius pseudohatsudake]|nr:hypothetical protein EDB85DRAFT_2156738 [Lactarius pseudohatsudake]